MSFATSICSSVSLYVVFPKQKHPNVRSNVFLPDSVRRLGEVGSLRLAVDVHGPEEAADFAFAQTRDVDVSWHSSVEVESGDVVRIPGAHEDGKV